MKMISFLVGLSSNILATTCVVLLTLLLVSGGANIVLDKRLTSAQEQLADCSSKTEKLKKENSALKFEVENAPKQYIEITRSVDKEVCDGKSLGASIAALPKVVYVEPKSTVTEVNKNVKKNTVDIDASLPDELIKLLK